MRLLFKLVRLALLFQLGVLATLRLLLHAVGGSVKSYQIVIGWR